MTEKRILDVGQCTPDHMALKALAQKAGASLVRVALPAQALELLQKESFDLVFVNRKIDADYTDGMELIHAMQARGLDTPVLLISNFPEAQAQAMAAGAVRGFGKNDLGNPATVEMVQKYLDPIPSAG